mmetsp:Transcript_3356/g.6737  ORF Transcript_3356/g.6737 Transcript_3356/m.6737 type:complete len:93 (-) Transcript_3356:25-303(-)
MTYESSNDRPHFQRGGLLGGKVKTISLVVRNCAVIVIKVVNFIQTFISCGRQRLPLITAPTLQRYEYISNANIMSILIIIFEFVSIEKMNKE